MIGERISAIHDHIVRICKKVGRNPQEITLLGVTKYASMDQIREAIQCGIMHIGENKVQDAQNKFEALGKDAASVTKHMIGHLQTNKVKTALMIFDMIQSVDSLKLAREIEKQAHHLHKTAEILIQVNCSHEEQKSGVAEDEVLDLIGEISHLNGIFIRGLMTMAPHTQDEKLIRLAFQNLRMIKEKAAKNFKETPNVEMRFLSMGMTQDYEIALEEGSNLVRIGSAIFGDVR